MMPGRKKRGAALQNAARSRGSVRTTISRSTFQSSKSSKPRSRPSSPYHGEKASSHKSGQGWNRGSSVTSTAAPANVIKKKSFLPKPTPLHDHRNVNHSNTNSYKVYNPPNTFPPRTTNTPSSSFPTTTTISSSSSSMPSSSSSMPSSSSSMPSSSSLSSISTSSLLTLNNNKNNNNKDAIKKTQRIRPAGAGWRGVDFVSAIQHSMCFHLETAVSSIQVVSSGDLIVCGFKDGSVRIFEMGSTHKSDSQGCLLGYVGSPGGMRTSLDVKVSLSDDSKFVFAGARKGSKVTFWNLDSYRILRKRRGFGTSEGVLSHSHTHSKLRGLGDVSTVIDTNTSTDTSSNNASSTSTYSSATSTHRLACGLGISNVHVWNVKIFNSNDPADWTLIYDQPTNGKFNFP
jgi:hypothetical protein